VLQLGEGSDIDKIVGIIEIGRSLCRTGGGGRGIKTAPRNLPP